MNVVVNGRFLSRRVTGVERYGREILRRLCGRLRVVRSGEKYDGARGHAWEQVTLPSLVAFDEILWSPANSGPVRVANQVLTLHDLSPLEHPEWFRASFALWYRLFVPVLVRGVRRVAVSSDWVQRKVMGRFGLPAGQVAVVPGGVDREIFQPAAPKKLELPSKYALFVGSIQPRKNLAGLLTAWDQATSRIPDTWLVIAGAGGRAFRPPGLPDTKQVIHLNAVADADLPGLYAGAALYIQPSFDEGSGLTLLEAMACGTPVAASNGGALPEIMGEAGLVFDPRSIPQMAETLRRGLGDEALRIELRERSLDRARAFSWEKSAQKMQEVFEACQ
jgi:glycosyltransferase involved in cell wall biosynthesis